MRVTKQKSATKTILLAAALLLEDRGRPRKRPGKPRAAFGKGITLRQAIMQAARWHGKHYGTPKATLSRARHAAMEAVEAQWTYGLGTPAHSLDAIDNDVSDTREIIRSIRAAARRIK